MRHSYFTIVLLIFIALSTSFSSSYSCTILNITQDDTTYVAANEDWKNDRFYLLVQPANGSRHGMLVFGVDDPEKYPFYGWNDQGLFFDLASAPQPRKLILDPQKETRDNPLYVEMLASCSSVKEAVGFLARFNISGLQRHHIMLVDPSGASVVIEGTAEGQLPIWKNGRHQIITNFLLSSSINSTMKKNGRYALADRMLRAIEQPTVESLQSILKKTSNSSSRYPTVLSSIFNLTELRLYMYFNGNFNKELVIDMQKELQRGKKVKKLKSIFASLSDN